MSESELCLCIDCSVDVHEIHEWYMVYEHVWSAAGMAYDGGFLCIGCLETRLGRRLVPDDFPNVPMHGVFKHSDRLMDRFAGFFQASWWPRAKNRRMRKLGKRITKSMRKPSKPQITEINCGRSSCTKPNPMTRPSRDNLWKNQA